MVKERKSNFELLRIVAIILIIMFHYCTHGNGETIFLGEFCQNKIISMVFGSWGIMGVDLFIFISAYFLIDSKQYKIEKVILIATTTFFYAVLFLILMYITKTIPFNLKETIYTFLSPLTDQYWFIPSYLMLFLFYPFINRFIKSVSRTTVSYLVLLLTLGIPLYRTIIYTAPIQGFSMFIYLYLLMAYLKGTPENFFEKNAKKGFFITFFVVVAGYSLCLWADNYLHSGISFKLFVRMFGNRYSPVPLVLAIFLFYIFKDMKLPSSKVINTVAKSTLGIYLIHENHSLYAVLWDKWLHIDIVYYRPTFLFYLLVSVVLIFAVCFLLDRIRILTVEKYIMIPLLKRSRWVARINQMYNDYVMTPSDVGKHELKTE